MPRARNACVTDTVVFQVSTGRRGQGPTRRLAVPGSVMVVAASVASGWRYGGLKRLCNCGQGRAQALTRSPRLQVRLKQCMQCHYNDLWQGQ